MQELVSLLKSEIKPALGVTEVGAIALGASRAFGAVGGTLLHIHMRMNGGMYKNAYSCGIPGTEELGGKMAASLGAFGGDWTLGLECLKNITPEITAQVKAMEIPVEIEVLTEKEGIFIEAEVTTTRGIGFARIKDTHSNIVFVSGNEEILFQKEENAGNSTEATFDFDTLTIEDLVNFARTVPLSEIDFLQEMIEMNCRLSEGGAEGAGLALGHTMEIFRRKGVLGEDMIYSAQALTCSAMDGRLGGLSLPAMSIVGSGSHGILCSLPVVSYGRSISASEEKILRGVALSALVTIYSKHYTGRLSSLCGCVLGGGSGAAAGIVFLMGGGAQEVSGAMDHMAANLTGMICDGGSTGCVLKASAGVYSAFLSAMLSMSGTRIPNNFGVVGSSAEQTVKNLGKISAKGMAPMDETILEIMQEEK